jgi:peptidyl-prolyl isomerase E (cyclophilin E)
MATNDRRVIYVGGLDESVTMDNLVTIFSVFGEVRSADVPMDVQNGKPRGFGFVEFLDPVDAEASIDNMHESEIYGRTISVKYSKRGQHMQLVDPKRAVWADDLYYRKILSEGVGEVTEH